MDLGALWPIWTIIVLKSSFYINQEEGSKGMVKNEVKLEALNPLQCIHCDRCIFSYSV